MHYSFHRRSLLALAALPLANAAANAAAVNGDTAQPLTAEAMLGKALRVIEPGSAITMDYSAERVNIELDAGRRISRVYIG